MKTEQTGAPPPTPLPPSSFLCSPLDISGYDGKAHGLRTVNSVLTLILLHSLKKNFCVAFHVTSCQLWIIG